MRIRRIWPVGVTIGMLAVDIAVGIYLFARNNVWSRKPFEEKTKGESRE